MTKRETMSLLIKILGIYLLVQIAPLPLYSLGFLPSMSRGGVSVVMWGVAGILFPIIWIFVCTLIIKKSDSLASRLCREDSDANQLTSLGFKDIQVLGYNFIGLMLLVQATPRLVQLITTIKTTQVYSYPSWSWQNFNQHNLPSLLYYLTELILGFILFLKPKGLASLWKKSQIMRYQKVNSDNKILEDIASNAASPQD